MTETGPENGRSKPPHNAHFAPKQENDLTSVKSGVRNRFPRDILMR